MRQYFYRNMISFDQMINTLLYPITNLFVDERGALFGYPDETISSVMGKNSKSKSCKLCSWICRWILHPIDKNHCEDAIEKDEGGTK